MVTPVIVTAFAVPTFLSANVPAAVPPTVTTSLPKTVTAAVPPKLAVLLVSYTLLDAVIPVTLKSACVMFAVRPVCCTRL